MDVYFAALSVLFGSLAACFLYKTFTSPSRKFPPGPRGFSALKAILRTMKEGNLQKQAKVWSDQYGELVLCRTVLGDLCFLNSARVVREMFADKEREHLTNNRPQLFFFPVLTYGHKDVGGSDPDLNPNWPKMRRLFHYAIKFYGDGVERFESTVQTELQRLMSRIEDKAGKEVEVKSLLSYSVLCILAVLMTGQCPDVDSDIIRKMREFNDADNEAVNQATDAAMTAFPFLIYIPGTYFRRLYQTLVRSQDAVMHELFDKSKESHRTGEPRGIIDVLLDEQLKKENSWFTDDHIRGMIVDLIAAGYQTSLGTLSALFLYLVHNPDVVSKIQKEVDEVIGIRPPKVEDRSKLPYTEAVVLETLRHSSNVTVALPHMAADDVSIRGFTIPKGTTILNNHMAVNRDPTVWGDPDVFRPERFLDDVTGELLASTHPVRQGLVSFGIGKRSCPGENFGRTRIFLYVTTLLQKFDILPPVEHELPPADPDQFVDGIVLMPRPYSVIFRRRS